ncbi:hypothetical protein ACQ4PT_047002 [Festuca glaucescens]
MAAPPRQRKRRANGANSSTTAPLLSTANGSVLPDELLYEILSVRRILIEDCPQHQFANVACTNLDLFCLVGEDMLPCILDPATGVVSPLSNDNQELYYNGHSTSLAFGRASSTGETKVLAITKKHRKVTSCKVLTLGGAGQWRDTGWPPTLLATSRCAPLVKGVLYFWAYDSNYRIDHIAAYDLDTEKWRQDLLHLPLPIHEAIPLAELSDTLVAVYRRNNDHTYRNRSDLCIDLWFLTDSEKVLWSKRYAITMPYHGCWRPRDASYGYGHPLWALDDGKIVFWVTVYWRRGEMEDRLQYIRCGCTIREQTLVRVVSRCQTMNLPVCTKGVYLLVFHGSGIKRICDYCLTVLYRDGSIH